MPRPLVFVLLALMCFQHGKAQVLGFAMDGGKQKVYIPFELHNNLVVVPVILNGRLPLKFILDTGVRTTILTDRVFSDILNLRYSRKYTIAGPGGEKLVDAFVTNNVAIHLPGVTGLGHAMLVLEEDYLELKNYLGADVHGILGYELFSRFIVKIEYDRKVITLMTPEAFHPRRSFKSMPMKVEDTKPYINAEAYVSDSVKIPLKLLVDSGASHGLVLDPESDKRIRVPSPSLASVIGRGLGGVITGRIARIPQLDIDGFRVMAPTVNYPDLNSYTDTLKATNVFRNGSLGGEILRRFTVIYDFPHERIYLRKNGDFKNHFFYNMSGIEVKAKGSTLKEFEVTEVRKGSPAEEADVRIGDEVVEVNSFASPDLTLNLINSLFNYRPGKRVVMYVKRKDQILKKRFLLRSPI
ncbi:MAG: aspartyl protease family protein [Cyclobacteriaceae bacterium]|nr:aspartyl protease family protein [Cyclobacteriaceae bacterium]